ncbi:hypothetical protein ES705_40067 [subsurface metagenome]
MKKLLIVLMIVAMASFLFVGCLFTPPPIDPVDPPGEKSEAPHIDSIYDSTDGDEIVGDYINEAQAEDGMAVFGYGLVGSEIQVYINGVKVKDTDIIFHPVGPRNKAKIYGDFGVLITEDELDVDGVKTVCATATQYPLAESALSDEFEFTLDRVAPEIIGVTGTWEVGDSPAGAGTLTVTFSEELDEYDEAAAGWSAIDMIPEGVELSFTNAELTEETDVVEVDFTTTALVDPANAFVVLYDGTGGITDLAGNPADDSFFFPCVLEIEEEVVEEPEEVAVDGVELNVAFLTLAMEKEATLVETVTPAEATDKSVTWTSSAANVAFAVNGVVYPLQPGQAVITVTTVDGGFADSCVVTVVKALKVVSAAFTSAIALEIVFSEAVNVLTDGTDFTDGKITAPAEGIFTISAATTGSDTIILTVEGVPVIATGTTGTIDIAATVVSATVPGNFLAAIDDQPVATF